jgi:hypothetical protein
VIYNRLQNGNFGSDISYIIRPNQFSTPGANPTSNAQALADQIQNGTFQPTLPSNALYYRGYGTSAAYQAANPASAAIINGGLQVTPKGNYYSDRNGAPSSGFASAFGTGAGSGGDGTPADYAAIGANNTQQYDAAGNPVDSGGLTDAQIDSGANYPSPGALAPSSTSSASDAPNPTQAMPGGIGSILGGIPGIPDQAKGAIGALAGAMGGGLTPNVDSAAGGQQSSNFDQGGGAPVTITDIAAAGGAKGGAGPEVQSGLQSAGKSVETAGGKLDTQIQTSEQAAAATGTGVANLGAQLADNPDTGWLPRIGVGVVAIVLVGMGLWMLGKEKAA